MVSGGGTIGLVSAATAIGMRARTIVIDPLAHRRETALKLGAEAVIDPVAEDAVERVKELTGGRGADLVIEAAGHDDSLGLVFDLAREEGRVAMVGINIGRKIGSHLGNIQMRNLTVRGCIGSPGVWPSPSASSSGRVSTCPRSRPTTSRLTTPSRPSTSASNPTNASRSRCSTA